MNFFGFLARMSAKEIQAEFDEIRGDSKRAAQEIGWHAPGEEQERRMQNVLASALSRLVLLHQKAYGMPRNTTASLLLQLRELIRMQSAVAQPADASSDAINTGWRFDWRRTLAILLWAITIALIVASVRTHDLRLIYLLLASFAGLWVLGPWQLPGYVAALADHVSKAANWVKSSLRASRLGSAIYRRERRLVKATQREELAKQWVEERLAVVRGEMEVQRARAAAAARLFAEHQQILQQKEEEVFHAG